MPPYEVWTFEERKTAAAIGCRCKVPRVLPISYGQAKAIVFVMRPPVEPAGMV